MPANLLKPGECPDRVQRTARTLIGRPMAHQKFNLIVANGMRFFLQLDPEDLAQRDVLAHFTNGQMYEHETSLLFLRVLRPGDAAVDVGGNAGYFTMLAATLVGPQGRVLTAEANPALVPLIRSSADLNAIGHLTLEELAVSDRNGETVFASSATNDSNGGVVPGRTPGERFTTEETVTHFVARTETLESLAARHGLERIRLLKIDTEGHELHVLRGAEGLLRDGRIDFVACEMNLPGLVRNGTDQRGLRGFMLGHGYHLFLLDPNGGMPRLVPPNTVVEQVYTCNALFARIERVGEAWPTIVNEPASIYIVRSAKNRSS